MGLLVFTAFLVLTAASPVNDRILPHATKSASFGSVVDKVVTSAKQQVAATAFCASYLDLARVMWLE